jgi:hypothetical protein
VISRDKSHDDDGGGGGSGGGGDDYDDDDDDVSAVETEGPRRPHSASNDDDK